MKRLIFLLVIGLFLFGLTTAEDSGETLTGKQNSCIELPQECGNCSYVQLNNVMQPNLIKLNIQLNMTKTGTSYSYTFCNTTQIGNYQYCMLGDVDGVPTSVCNDFEITPSGFLNTLGLYLIFLIVLIGVIILGFGISEEWFVVIGGMGLIMLGIYSINSGIVGFKDMFMTWGIGLFIIGIGTILSVGAAFNKFETD